MKYARNGIKVLKNDYNEINSCLENMFIMELTFYKLNAIFLFINFNLIVIKLTHNFNFLYAEN